MSALPVEDTTDLIRLEQTIERGITTFIEVGSALLEIRDRRLYKESYDTFDAYCKERWKMSHRHANRLIGAADVASDLGPMGPKISERTIRPLVELPKPERKAAFNEAVAKTNGKPTAKAVQEAVDRRVKPSGRSIVNGVETDDPPQIAELRSAGKVAGIPIIETSDDHTDVEDIAIEREERRAKTEDDLSDEDWLATLPLSSKLTGTPLKTFQRQALLYRDIDPARATFHHTATRAITKRGKGRYQRAISFFLRVDHPKKWEACLVTEKGGCGGFGQVPMIGRCPLCIGEGFTINGN